MTDFNLKELGTCYLVGADADDIIRAFGDGEAPTVFDVGRFSLVCVLDRTAFLEAVARISEDHSYEVMVIEMRDYRPFTIAAAGV